MFNMHRLPRSLTRWIPGLILLVAPTLRAAPSADSLARELVGTLQAHHLQMPPAQEALLLQHLLTLQLPAYQGFAWLWWAELEEHQGNDASADTLYRHALQALPDSLRLPVLLRRIQLNLHLARWDSARALLHRALARSPEPRLRRRLLNTLARLDLATGRAQEALELLRQAQVLPRLQGFALYQMGRLREALQVLEPFDDDTARLLRALAAFRLGRNLTVTRIPRSGAFREPLTLLAGLAFWRRAVPDSARALLQRIQNPVYRPYARYTLAALTLRQGRVQEALNLLPAAPPSSLEPLFRFLEAQALGFLNRTLEALASYRSLELRTDSTWAAFYRLKYAEALLQAGQAGPARSQLQLLPASLADSLVRHRRYLEAVAALQEGALGRAYMLLQALQQEVPAPWSPYVAYLLGLVAYRQGYYGLAQRHLQQARSLPGLQNRIRLYLGDCAFNLRQYREAARWFREVWQAARSPEEQREALWGMALSLYRLRRYAEAAQWLEQLVKTWPNAPHTSLALYLMATSWEMAGNLEKALQALDLVARQGPRDLQDRILLERGNLLYNHGRYAEALEAYRRLLEQFPTSPLVDQALEGLFWAAQKMQRTDTLNILLASLRQRVPQLDTLLLLREAQFRYNIGEYGRALALADSFLQRAAEPAARAEALWTAGMAAYRLEQCDRAIQYFEALKGREEADFRRAECLARMGRTREALQAFRGFLRHHALSTFRPQALYQVAQLALSLGDSATADSFFARLYHQYPRHPLTDAALVAWAPLLFQKGQREQAVALLDTVIGRHTDELAGRAWLTKGDLLRQWGDLKGAVEAYVAAATLFDAHPDIARPALWRAAETYQKMDRWREAVVAYRRYARRYPEDSRAREARIRADRLERRLLESPDTLQRPQGGGGS